MKLTKQWLKKKDACQKGIDAFCQQKETDSVKILKLLIKSNEKEKLQWANWLIARLFTNKKQKVSYAIYAAKLALPIFEATYPRDKRPRQAIEAAEKYLKNPTKKNKVACKTAGYAAYAAAYGAWAAADATAAYAADAAYWTARSAADATAAYGAWAADVAYAAAYAADVAYNKTLIKILKYGITLFK